MSVDHIANVVENLPPEQALDAVLAARETMRFCLTSSFQAEDMAVLHILRKRIPDAQIWMVRVGYRFVHRFGGRDERWDTR